MALSPEHQRAYEESMRPFLEGGGAIGPEQSRMRPWRVFLEINSACNLKCPSCTKGNKDGYEHLTGLMETGLMERCLDKVASENPQAIVFLYGNSEPFLHPRLPECIAAVKQRGLRCELSTNLNYLQRVDDTLSAHPDFMIISLSGFTQEVYVKGHAGGNIEKVKTNMRLLGEANARTPSKVQVAVNYHIYNDNGHELDQMRAYAAECGIGFFTSTARAISMENAIQYCRENDPEATPYDVQEGKPNWNDLLPPTSDQWKTTMGRLRIPPTEARAMYQKYPVSNTCAVGAGGMFAFIRHDGKTSMCSCCADRRITVGDYMDTSVDEMFEQRANHPICKQCIKYRTNLYFMIADRDKWD